MSRINSKEELYANYTPTEINRLYHEAVSGIPSGVEIKGQNSSANQSQPTQADNGRGRFSQTRQSYRENAEQKKEQQRALDAIRPQLNFPQYETVEQTRAALQGFEEKNRGHMNGPLSEVLYDADVKKYTDQINLLSKFESGELGADFFGRGLDENILAGQMQKDKAAREQQRAESQYEAEVSQRISDGLSTEGTMNKKFASLRQWKKAYLLSIIAEIEQEEARAGNITTIEQEEEHRNKIRELTERANAFQSHLKNAPQAYVGSDRMDAIFSSWGDKTAASYLNLAGNVGEQAKRYNLEADENTYAGFTPQQRAEYDRLMQQRAQLEAARANVATFEQSEEIEKAWNDINRQLEALGVKPDLSGVNNLYAMADEKNADYMSEFARAKEGQSKAEQFLIDAAHTGLDIGADALASMATGGIGGRVNMALRSYGAAAGQARAEGDDANTAMGKGLTSALVELGSEMLGGGFEKVYGKSVIGKAVDKAMESPYVKALISSAGEGAEEGVANVLQIAADQMFGWSENTDGNFLQRVGADVSRSKEDILYEMLIGAFVGVFGSGQSIINNTQPTAPKSDYTAPKTELKPTGSQSAQETVGGTQIPPSTQTASTGQTERLNQQEANSIPDELVSYNRNTDENGFNVRNGNGKETVSNEPVQQPSNVDLLLEATGNVAEKTKENADTVLQEVDNTAVNTNPEKKRTGVAQTADADASRVTSETKNVQSPVAEAEASNTYVSQRYENVNSPDLGQNVRSFEAPTEGELKFTSGKRMPVSDEQKENARALNASDLKGHNVRVAEPPKADDNKAATVKNNFGSRSAQAKNAADKIAGRFTEKKDKNGNVISNSGTVLADRVRAVADGNSDLSNFRDYYSRLKDSPKSETRSLYYKEVAEKLDEADANLYGEDGNRERGHKLAADALSLLSKRIEQRDAADAVIAKTKGKISELTKKFKETGFYKNKISKEKGIKLTAGLLTPRNYLKMIDGFSAEAGGEGYKLANKETEANKKEKELIVEAKNLFNGFLETKDAEKFLSGYFKSGVKLGDHELSMIELTHLVREWESALESREGGIGGIAFKAKGKPVSYGKDAKLIVADERGVKTELSLGDEGAITRLRKTLDFLSDKNEVLSEYNKALDKVFEYMLPKLKEAHMNTEGYDMGEILDGKYFPVAYMPKGGALDTEGESFFSLFRNVKDRTRQDGGILLIDPTEGVIDRYIQNSAQYAAWADFSRQMQMLSEKGAGGTSLMDVVEENLGADVAKTLKEYADALKFESSFTEKNGIEKAAGFLRKNLGQAALTLKLTTPLKQAAGTVAAAGDIKLSYLLMAQFGGGRKYKNAAGENKLYQHRTLGNIDSTVGNVANLSDTAWKKAIAKIPFVGEKWLTSISRADQNAIKNIYYAAAMQVSAENGNADITKSDALMKQVDELFADALLNTQSDATKISASSIYRSNNELTKNVTLFKSQQNAQLNATIAAALEAHAAKGTASESKAKDKYARAVAGQIVSSAEFAILGAIADAVLHKHGKYQDDEDEFTFESIVSELGDNAAETLFGIHLFGDTLYSVMAAAAQAATGKEPDSIFNPSLGGINTVVDITSKLNSVLKSPSAKNIKNFAVSMSNASGVPLSGFYDVISGASLWIKDIVSSIEGKKISISSERDILNELLFDIDKKKAVTGKGIAERTADAISGDKISEQRKAAYRVIDELVESTGKLSLTPANFEGKIEHNSKEYTLSRKERQKYSDTAMDTYYSLVDELVEEASFKNAVVELKEAIVLEAKKYAIDAARAEYFENADIEYTSEFKNINEGIVKRGKDDDGNPKPDIPAIPKKDIAEYLAYKTAFSAAEKAENYTALDALLEDYKKLPNASRQQFKQGNHSSLIDAYEAGVSSKSYNKYTETLKKQAEKHDLDEDNSVAKLYGVSNAKISGNEKNALAELVLSKNTKTVYQAAVKHDYPTADIPELYEKINVDGDGYIEQAELYSVYKANPAMEALLEEIWNSNGWKTSLQQYKSKQR